MTAPSLQEIADMPLSQSLSAVRESYDKNWKKHVTYNEEEEEAEPCSYKVRVYWKTAERGGSTYTVFAKCEEEAADLARDMASEADDNLDVYHWDIVS